MGGGGPRKAVLLAKQRQPRKPGAEPAQAPQRPALQEVSQFMLLVREVEVEYRPRMLEALQNKLDAVADSFRWGSSFLLGVEGALLGGATTMAEGIPGAQLVIPCHYEMFAFNTADPAEFIKASNAIAQAYQVLRCGERWESTAVPRRSERRDWPEGVAWRNLQH